MTQFFDFTNKVVVITGAGGVICGELAKSFGKQGAKVALLDLNEEAAQKFADEIIAEGGIAKAYKTNVLEKESLEAVREAVNKDLGTVDVLVNGAGGNNPRATTDNEFHEVGLSAETKTFFDLDKESKLSLRFLLCSLIILQNKLRNHHQLVKLRHLQNLKELNLQGRILPLLIHLIHQSVPLVYCVKFYLHVELDFHFHQIVISHFEPLLRTLVQSRCNGFLL